MVVDGRLVDVDEVCGEVGVFARIVPQLVVSAEDKGYVVDLETGHVFKPEDDWQDFFGRWATERRRRGLSVDRDAFGEAVHRASAGEVSGLGLAIVVSLVCDV